MKFIGKKAQNRIAKSLNEIIGSAFDDKIDTNEMRKLVRNICNICVDCKLDPALVITSENIIKDTTPKRSTGQSRSKTAK